MADLDVTALFRSHAGFVERVLRRGGVPERDLSDATQEVFVVVHRRLPEFEGRANPRTWLYRIAWNVASETRRRAYRRHELLDVTHEARATCPDAGELCERDQSVRALLDAIDRLEPDKREALICFELDEQPMSEVAARLGIPRKTAFSRLYAARRALQAELRKQGFACSAWWALSLRRALRPAPLKLNLPAFGYAGAQSLVVALALLVTALPGQSARPLEPKHALLPTAAVSFGAATTPRLDTRPSLRPAAPAARTPQARARRHAAFAPVPAALRPLAEVSTAEAPAEPQELSVVRTGELDLGAGPFGQSPLANPPLVAPDRHPRARIVWLQHKRH